MMNGELLLIFELEGVHHSSFIVHRSKSRKLGKILDK